MKWHRLFSIALMAFISLKVSGQTPNIFSKSSYIEPYKLEITLNKTTNLIFPAAITSVDRGSRDILVQKATGVENILRIKGDVKNFTETSLSVITSDGKLYSFVVGYTEQPSYLNINVNKISQKDSMTIEDPVIYSERGINKLILATYADSVISHGNNMRPIHKESSKVSIALNALYIKEDVLFCLFSLKNNSVINYDIDQLHFFIRDRKKADRTASQEIEIHPLTIVGDTLRILSQSKLSWVIALRKFTIPDGKYLSVEVMEKNGGRNLFLKVRNRHIMKAQPLTGL
jgi:Bacteroides conjugative transposon TraN protein